MAYQPTPPTPPGPPPVPAVPFAFDAVPDGMLIEKRWVCWRPEWRATKDGGGKWTKVPVNPHTGGNAASNRPQEWGRHREAVAGVKAYAGRGVIGIGFVLGGGWVGVDVDHDVEAGVLGPTAAAVVARLGGYAELSPSSTGVHVLLRGDLPVGKGRKRGKVEMYGEGRFFTVTGWRLDDVTPDENGYTPAPPEPASPTPEELEAFRREYFPDPAPPAPVILPPRSAGDVPELTGTAVTPLGSLMPRLDREREPRKDRGEFVPPADDAELLRMIQASKQGAKFAALWEGKYQAYYGSASEADLALVSILNYWAKGDTARVNRLFCQSALYRDKWLARRGESTYGERTIRKVTGS
jgi:primase-polymerase (primpol)-like protein